MINLIKNLVTVVLIAVTVALVSGMSVALSAFTVNYAVLEPVTDSKLVLVADNPSLSGYLLVAGATVTVCLAAYLCYWLNFTVLYWVSLRIWRWDHALHRSLGQLTVRTKHY